MAITAGVHTTNVANKWLDGFRNQTGFIVASVYVQLHTGVPGLSCTASASAETTRQQVTFSAASGGSMSASNTPSWTSWDAGTETITHISLWSLATGGVPLWSGPLTTGKQVQNGDTFTLSSLTLAITGLGTDA